LAKKKVHLLVGDYYLLCRTLADGTDLRPAKSGLEILDDAVIDGGYYPVLFLLTDKKKSEKKK